MRARLLAALKHLVGLSIVFAPLAGFILAGSLYASLWLDEVLYWYFEQSPPLRALQMGRPGSAIAPYFGNYFYSDIQRGVHWFLRAAGFTVQDDPELYLRFLSLFSFIALAVLTYVLTFRQSRSWSWSVAAALTVSASPLLLFYAFEARVSSFAALGVALYLVLLGNALHQPRAKRFWIAGALLGIFLGHLHLWVVCLYAGLCLAAFIRSFATRQWLELAPIAAFTIPGAITAVAEAAFITYTSPPGGQPFPLYTARSLLFLQERTIAGLFSTGSALPDVLSPPWFVPSLPIIALITALLLLFFDLRRSPEIVFPAAAVLSLWISVEVGSRVGFLIAPRYQVPLFAALFFSLRLAPRPSARLLVAFTAALDLVLLPNAIADVAAKGNGKEIAALIDSETPRERTAVVVQHGLTLGYPDPLHNFVLQFYLDDIRPESAPVRIFEMPSLRDITGLQGVRDYFGGGAELLQQYASTPAAHWKEWLSRAPFDRVWLVTPVPAMKPEHVQAMAFRAALGMSGFTAAGQPSYGFDGYPPTFVSLFVRRDPHDPTRANPAHQ